jgi:lambda repressor-like predicted transcriptional regulator
MHPEDIKAMLRKAGSSQAGVARALGVNQTTVFNVIHGACKSERIAKAIADVVGVDRAVLWPGRYATLNERIRRAA